MNMTGNERLDNAAHDIYRDLRLHIKYHMYASMAGITGAAFMQAVLDAANMSIRQPCESSATQVPGNAIIYVSP